MSSNPPQTSTVSQALLATMKAHGIRHVFGIPAAQLGHLMQGAAHDPDIRFLTVRHEEAAGHMAHAIAKTTGRMAACFGTVGPGAMNLVPGVAAAWADNMPLLAITPNNQSWNVDPGKGLLQSVDQVGVYTPITKWSVPIREPVSAARTFDHALRTARSGRPGPVHLDLPCDIGGMPCDFDPAQIAADPPPRPAPAAADVDRVVSLLRSARRPVLVAGGGVARSCATEAFRRLLRLTNLPATTSLNGRGVVPHDYTGHVGSGGILGGLAVVKAFAEADLVVLVGCKLSSWMPLNKPPLYSSPAGQKLVQVDISERVLGRNMKADVAIQADAREFLDALNAALSGVTLGADPAWIDAMRAAHRAYRSAVDAIADAGVTTGTTILNEAAAARAICALLPSKVVVAIDGGQTCEWMHTYYHPAEPEDLLFNPGMGHLGMGLPAANAAKLARPQEAVVCVTGDGAMGCTVQELETAVRYGLNVVVFVFNDSHWGMYRPLGDGLLSDNPMRFGTQLGKVDFGMVARGFGCHGERVTRLDEIPAAYARAIASGKPAVIDVIVDFTPHPVDEFWVGHVLEGANLVPATPG